MVVAATIKCIKYLTEGATFLVTSGRLRSIVGMIFDKDIGGSQKDRALQHDWKFQAHWLAIEDDVK